MPNNKILFALIPEKGHINPLIGVAQHLQAAGYELAFFAQTDISEQLNKAGLPQNVYTGAPSTNSDKDFITRGKAFVEQLKNKPWLRNWIKTLLIDAVPLQLKLIEAAALHFQPALIVTDPMIYASAIAAHRLNIPWAGISSSLNPVTPSAWQCELTHTLDTLDAPRKALFQSYGLKPRFKVSDAISPWLNIVFSTEAYISRELSENDFSFYAGHSFPLHSRGDETDFPFHRLIPGTKKVYMSLGSQIYYHPHLFSAIAQALLEKDIQLIFSLNELLSTPFAQQLPDNVIAVAYAPQLQLLKQVDLMVTHGGANSVMESLAHGVPVALLPICNDQFLQAKFVTRAGAGIVLDPTQPIPEVYRQQLLPLLDHQSPVSGQAAKIGASFHRYGGAKAAAKLIAQLHKTKKPMHPAL